MNRCKPQEGDLKVWWKPQVPCESFEYPVKDIPQAKMLLKALALYDLFQLNHKIKPDYCNAGGLVQFQDGEWLDWCNDDGDSIDDVMTLGDDDDPL